MSRTKYWPFCLQDQNLYQNYLTLAFFSLAFCSTSTSEPFKSQIAYEERVFLFLGLVKQTRASFCSQKNLRVTGLSAVEEKLLKILDIKQFITILYILQINKQFEIFKYQKLSLMSEKKKIKLTFGDMNEKNINILRKVNFNALPVKYSTAFYIKVALEYAKLSKYCYYNDIAIGAYTTRVEDFKGEKHAYILTFSVLEPYRKFGVGRQMMENLEKVIKQNSDAVGIYLHMHVLNEVGKKFYQSCGFTILQRLDNYYTDLEEPHCYIMRKMLKQSPAHKQDTASQTQTQA